MGFIQNLFGGGAGKLIDSVGNVIDNLSTSKEEKQQLDNEIKKAHMDWEVEMRKLSVEEQQHVLQDVQSARLRESEIQKSEHASWLGKNVASLLAIGTPLLAFTLFYFILFDDITTNFKEEKKDILIYILGVLSAIVTQIFSYYFGSSSGSAEKNRMLKEELKKV